MTKLSAPPPSRLLNALATYDAEREEEIAYWKSKAFEWEKKYTDLLNECVRNADASSSALLTAILAGAFATPEERAARKKDGANEVMEPNT